MFWYLDFQARWEKLHCEKWKMDQISRWIRTCISPNQLEISFLSNFNIFKLMLLDPTDVFESSQGIMLGISNLLVGLRKK